MYIPCAEIAVHVHHCVHPHPHAGGVRRCAGSAFSGFLKNFEILKNRKISKNLQIFKNCKNGKIWFFLQKLKICKKFMWFALDILIMARSATPTKVSPYKRDVPKHYQDHNGMVRGRVRPGSPYAERPPRKR
jgi:hypothetical protein